MIPSVMAAANRVHHLPSAAEITAFLNAVDRESGKRRFSVR
jgi:hypothetical protein